MGAFYNSICAHGASPERVEELLERWLEARGFEPSERPDLFDLDGDRERCAYLLSSERWVVVFFSHHDEERRLLHALAELDAPLLYVWVYDSDVWGYDVLTGGAFAGSFSSDPRSYVPFPDHPVGGAERPASEPARLARLLDRRELEADLRRLERRRRPFPEEVCRELCRRLEVEPAVASFDDLERGAAGLHDGWRCRRLLFTRSAAGRPPRVDLHDHPLTRWKAPAEKVPASDFEIPAELLRELRQAHRRRRLVMLALRPVSWLARSWRAVSRAAVRLGDRLRAYGEPDEFSAIILGSPFEQRGDWLLNPRHRCRIRLVEGAAPVASSSKPSAVFALRLDDTLVTCSARRLESIGEVLRQPARAQLLVDEPYSVGPWPARRLSFELPRRAGAERSWLGIHVVQTELAFYVFLYRRTGRPRPEVDARVQEVVESFSVEPRRHPMALEAAGEG